MGTGCTVWSTSLVKWAWGIPGRTRYYMMLFMAFKIVGYKAKDVFLNRFVFL